MWSTPPAARCARNFFLELPVKIFFFHEQESKKKFPYHVEQKYIFP
jgi:hypothetical protein